VRQSAGLVLKLAQLRMTKITHPRPFLILNRRLYYWLQPNEAFSLMYGNSSAPSVAGSLPGGVRKKSKPTAMSIELIR
jgi:hypothetical protein